MWLHPYPESDNMALEQAHEIFPMAAGKLYWQLDLDSRGEVEGVAQYYLNGHADGYFVSKMINDLEDERHADPTRIAVYTTESHGDPVALVFGSADSSFVRDRIPGAEELQAQRQEFIDHLSRSALFEMARTVPQTLTAAQDEQMIDSLPYGLSVAELDAIGYKVSDFVELIVPSRDGIKRGHKYKRDFTRHIGVRAIDRRDRTTAESAASLLLSLGVVKPMSYITGWGLQQRIKRELDE